MCVIICKLYKDARCDQGFRKNDQVVSSDAIWPESELYNYKKNMIVFHIYKLLHRLKC